MSRFIYLLDAGHGGLDPETCEYVTAPKKMYRFDDGLTIHEGVINREILFNLVDMLKSDRIQFEVVSHRWKDISLSKRSSKANKIQREKGNCIYVSIHCNAGKGTGLEVWTSPGETKSDAIAEILAEELFNEFPEEAARTDRSDGDLDKESRFHVLVKTSMPAVLGETFFFDRRKDAEKLDSHMFLMRISKAYYKAIKRIENEIDL